MSSDCELIGACAAVSGATLQVLAYGRRDDVQ